MYILLSNLSRPSSNEANDDNIYVSVVLKIHKITPVKH